MATAKKPVDYSERPISDGRYAGDLWAELTVLPGPRKPYRVQVWVWRKPYRDDAVFGWYEARKSDYAEAFPFERHFKGVWDAAKYIGEVRGAADAELIVRRAEKAVESGRTRIA